MAKSNFLKDNSSLIIGLVVVYFGYTKIIKPLLEGVGLSKSESELEIEKQTSNPASPWNLTIGVKAAQQLLQTARWRSLLILYGTHLDILMTILTLF